jgi:hypothetical protein
MIAKLLSFIILLSAPLVSAAASGEFCFFFAPHSLAGLGHIGWGFKIPGTTELYQYGATEDSQYGDTWTAQGTKAQMLQAFPGWAYPKWGNKYLVYKCMNTTSSDVASAEKVVQYQQTKANAYNLITNNCLTQSLDISKKYATHDVYNKIAIAADAIINPIAMIMPADFWQFVPGKEQKLSGK